MSVSRREANDIKVEDSLDLRGIPCPQNAGKAVVKLSTMSSGEILMIDVDDGEPLENVSSSIEGEGHRVLQKQRSEAGTWNIYVEVDGLSSAGGIP